MKHLRIGSRGSILARWQAEFVRKQLFQLTGVEAEIVIIKTSGDKLQQAPLTQIGGKGIFIKELEEALLEEAVDLAVHSVKDIPTDTPGRLHFPAVCRRDDVRDCVVSHSGTALAQLKQGARVGTSSLRRQAQLRHHRPDLDIRDLRGNVDTRLRKVASGGELSRTMLALKTVLASHDRPGTLVFDEIDANVGGRLGDVLGQKLAALGKTHQVICVTHLPQVASYARHQWTIRKTQRRSRTTTTIVLLDEAERLEELASMLRGEARGETTRKEAEAMLEAARRCW